MTNNEACIGVLGVQYLSDTVFKPFYFHGYMILPILLPGIWDTQSVNILVTFRDIEYLVKLIMLIFASLIEVLACLLQGIWNIWYPLYNP